MPPTTQDDLILRKRKGLTMTVPSGSDRFATNVQTEGYTHGSIQFPETMTQSSFGFIVKNQDGEAFHVPVDTNGNTVGQSITITSRKWQPIPPEVFMADEWNIDIGGNEAGARLCRIRMQA